MMANDNYLNYIYNVQSFVQRVEQVNYAHYQSIQTCKGGFCNKLSLSIFYHHNPVNDYAG